jgi:hypothetical protein
VHRAGSVSEPPSGAAVPRDESGPLRDR